MQKESEGESAWGFPEKDGVLPHKFKGIVLYTLPVFFNNMALTEQCLFQ
jgi:hypothetical protein